MSSMTVKTGQARSYPASVVQTRAQERMPTVSAALSPAGRPQVPPVLTSLLVRAILGDGLRSRVRVCRILIKTQGHA